MVQSLEQFAKSLLASGLPFAAEFEAFLQGRAAAAQPADGEQCARMLVKEKKLTAYQAQEVYAGRGKKLVLGNYVIHDKLGQGGMGMVLKAEHKRMGRMVALKVMSAAGMANPDAVKRFQREVQAAAKLTHPNIVTAHDADEAAGQHFLVMEYVEGSDLSQLVKKNGPMSVEKALHCILQAAKGLEFAHAKGVVHRDIKPANLLLDGEGTVKILDMGLARLEHSPEQGELTGTGQVMGTVDYMAPEQAMSTKTADSRADIYSLGITLWYLLTARVAYEGDTLMAKLMAHSTGPIPSLAAGNPNVSSALDATFKKMVAKTPAERFQSMTEVLAALERCRSGLGDVAPTINLPSEDSKLSEFLHGIGKSPSRSGVGSSAAAPVASPVAVAAPPVPSPPNAAFEQTIDTGNPQTDTDPQTQTNLIVPRPAEQRSSGAPPAATSTAPTSPAKPEPPAKPWHADWRVWTFGSAGLGGVLLVGLLIFFFTRGGDPPSPGPPKKGSTAPRFALNFDGKLGYVRVPTLTIDRAKPLTVEAWIHPSHSGENAAVVRFGALPELQKLGFYESWLVADYNRTTWRVRAATGAPVHKQRQHLACVWLPNGDRRLFVNGSPLPITESSGAITALDNPAIFEGGFLIGAAGMEANCQVFPGSIDELQVSQAALYQGAFTPLDPLSKDTSTLALYHFDEGTGDVLKDSSGHNHHGKIVGAKWVGLASSKSPNAPREPESWLTLSGKDQYVTIPGVASRGQNPVTLEVWVRPEVVQDAHVAYLPGDQPILLQHAWNAWAMARFQNGAAKNLKTDQSPAARRWYHLAAVWDGSRMQFWVNGKPQTAPAPDWLGTQPGGEFYLGGEPPTVNGGWSRFFTGDLGPARVSSTARYKAEFTPVARWTPDGDTLALYHFDEGSGEVLKDSSGHNHHGKIVGAKWGRMGGTTPSATPVPAGGAFALQFDGDDEVRFATRPPYDPASCTIEAYVRIDALAPRAMIYSPAGQNGLGLDFNDGSDWRMGMTLVGGGHHATQRGTTKVELGRRIHVAGVSDAEGTRVYVDGKFVCKSPPLRGRQLEIPKGQAQAGNRFQGLIEGIKFSKTPRYTSDFTPPAHLDPDGDTIALYRFDEGAGEDLKDSSGNNHHGKIVGAKWAKAGAASLDYALAFNGKSDHVVVEKLSLDRAQPLTVEAWVVPSVANSHVAVARFGRSPQFTKLGATSNGWWIMSDYKAPTWSAGILEERLQVHRRIHLAGVWMPDGDRRLYVNGTPATPLKSVTGSMPAPETPGEFMIGAMGSGVEPFSGIIDELRVSQTARYTGAFTPDLRFTPDVNTLALYHFDEGAGDELKDSSGHNHHGKIVGAKWVKVDAGAAEQEAYAARSGLPIQLSSPGGMKFRLIPPGEFVMGSAEQNPVLPADDRTPHKVRITKPFYLGAFEVSREDYQAVIGTSPNAFTHEATLPVEMVSWLDAVAFCNALSAKEGLSPCYEASGARKPGGSGYRLPSEAEWEYAARAGSTGTYYFGDPADLEKHAWIDTNSGGKTHGVGLKLANPWGLHDMYGNVWEWCGDWYGADYYRRSPPDDPLGPATGVHAIFRGGAWDNTANGMNNSYCRPFSNAAYVGPPTRRDNRIGFRVALSVQGAKQLRAVPPGGNTPPTGAAADPWKNLPAEAPPPAKAPFVAKDALAHQVAWATYLKVPVEYPHPLGIKFRLIPPGEYLRGSSKADVEAHLVGVEGFKREFIRSEEPQHRVVLTRPFYLATCEVTQGQYVALMRTNPSGMVAESYNKNIAARLAKTDTSRFPVDSPPWVKALEYCNALSDGVKVAPYYEVAADHVADAKGPGFRLPTDAEWEFACRAGTTSVFWCGNDPAGLAKTDWLTNNDDGLTHDVGQLAANPFGLHDMHGNVNEWCEDAWSETAFEPFRDQPAVDPRSPLELQGAHVLRGSNFYEAPQNSRSSVRGAAGGKFNPWGFHTGMRPAIDVEGVRQALSRSGPKNLPGGAPF